MRFRFEMAVALVVAALANPVLSTPALADVDSEHLFGFTEGTDIGTPFLPEGELETIGAFGRSTGSYGVQTLTASLKYPLSEHFRVAPSLTLARFKIDGMPDIPDIDQIRFDRATLEFRWRPFPRETSLFGLTFVAAPFFGFVDEESGAPGDSWGTGLLVAADRAVIADRLFVALNLGYDFERVRDYATGQIEDGSALKLSAAVTGRIAEWLYLGGEARYVRVFDSLAFGNLLGQAVLVGPTFYLPIGHGASLSGGWNFQAWGQTTGMPAGLDLAFFERNTFKLRLAIDL